MIHYVKGDATRPEANCPNGISVIVHCCNDIGAWGRGFVLSLSKRWDKPERCYLAKYKMMQLGDIQLVTVEPNIIVCNLIGQHGIRSNSKRFEFENGMMVMKKNNIQNQANIPLRYDALELGFRKLRQQFGKRNDITIHMPKIGCGLAGGDWRIVSSIIERVFEGIDVFVYEL